MPGAVTLALAIVILHLNLLGLALATRLLFGGYRIARVASPPAAALFLFFIEHGVGLGRPYWVWPLASVVSAVLLVRHRQAVREHWGVEAVFMGSFAWALAWRGAFPGLGPGSEKLGNLAMIVSYLPGERLPPQDAWLPPYALDMYYTFQHYAAALIGRALDLGPGLTYNLAFCVLVALTITAAAVCAFAISQSAAAAALTTVAFAAGGTGATVLVHFMVASPALHGSMRFIGGTATHPVVTTSFGRQLIDIAGVRASPPPLELPLETFAYLTWLGDYHPPLSGFFLLMLALLCLAVIETQPASRAAQGVLAGTVPVCAVANAWSLPLQAILVVTWVLYRLRVRRPPHWRALATGAVLAFAACYPFLHHFAGRAADYNVTMRLVRSGEHTPLLLGLILLWPVAAAVLVPVVLGERRRWILWASALWLALLVFSEVAFVDDIYSGRYERFNTTLKWWPWIQAGALLVAGAYGLRSPSRACRYVTFAILTAVSLYGVDLMRVLVRDAKPEAGRLEGSAWLTGDPSERSVLEFLAAQPRGIVLQRLEAGSFTPAPALTLFAGQTAFLGWPEHEKLWRGGFAEVTQRAADVTRFYAGEMPDAAGWLVKNRIDHVLWLTSEQKLPLETFARIDEAIRGHYTWRELSREGARVGVWSKAQGSMPNAQAYGLGYRMPYLRSSASNSSRDRFGGVSPGALVPISRK